MKDKVGAGPDRADRGWIVGSWENKWSAGRWSSLGSKLPDLDGEVFGATSALWAVNCEMMRFRPFLFLFVNWAVVGYFAATSWEQGTGLSPQHAEGRGILVLRDKKMTARGCVSGGGTSPGGVLVRTPAGRGSRAPAAGGGGHRARLPLSPPGPVLPPRVAHVVRCQVNWAAECWELSRDDLPSWSHSFN